VTEDLPWIVGGVVALIFFFIFEARAIRHPERYNTLSLFLVDLGQRWPISIFFMGALVGALTVHLFYYHGHFFKWADL
jgi:hypothetical protein